MAQSVEIEGADGKENEQVESLGKR